MREIIKKYNTGKLCTCIDEKHAGGFWDLAGEYADEMKKHDIFKNADYEILQEAYYDGLKAGSMIREHDGNYCNLDK